MKKDAPSGTALEISRQIQTIPRGRDIPLASVRAGYIPGTHELGFDSEADTVVFKPHGAGPAGLCGRRAVCCPLGGWQEGILQFRGSVGVGCWG